MIYVFPIITQILFTVSTLVFETSWTLTNYNILLILRVQSHVRKIEKNFQKNLKKHIQEPINQFLLTKL